MNSIDSAQSILVTGGDREEREAKALELIDQPIENSPDFFCLLGETIGIEEVRQLQKWLILKPFQEEIKVALIKEAQALTPEAQNALLKTLEEPPAKSRLILTVPEESLLLLTVVSRCRIIALKQKPQVVLSLEETSDLTNLAHRLKTLSIGERFEKLESLSLFKEKRDALVFLDQLTVAAREIMLNRLKGDEKNLSAKEALALLFLIEKTKKYLLANCNLRLTLEAFLIAFPG
jgi:DNA polymerase III gamma/tau subunit